MIQRCVVVEMRILKMEIIWWRSTSAGFGNFAAKHLQHQSFNRVNLTSIPIARKFLQSSNILHFQTAAFGPQWRYQRTNCARSTDVFSANCHHLRCNCQAAPTTQSPRSCRIRRRCKDTFGHRSHRQTSKAPNPNRRSSACKKRSRSSHTFVLNARTSRWWSGIIPAQT